MTTCNCVRRSDGGVSVIGACGCPIHGMTNLRACLARIVDLYRDEDGDLVVKAGWSVADDALIAAVEALSIPGALRAEVPR